MGHFGFRVQWHLFVIIRLEMPTKEKMKRLKKHFIGQYGNDNSIDNNNYSNYNNSNNSNRRTHSNNHRTNNYGMLTDENIYGRFQSRWDDGPNNLIWQTWRITRPDSYSCFPVSLSVSIHTIHLTLISIYHSYPLISSLLYKSIHSTAGFPKGYVAY